MSEHEFGDMAPNALKQMLAQRAALNAAKPGSGDAHPTASAVVTPQTPQLPQFRLRRPRLLNT